MKLLSMIVLAGLLTPGLIIILDSNKDEQVILPGFSSRDDVQYFPTGSEEQLPNLKRALKQYNLEQEALKSRAEETNPPLRPVRTIASPDASMQD